MSHPCHISLITLTPDDLKILADGCPEKEEHLNEVELTPYLLTHCWLSAFFCE